MKLNKISGSFLYSYKLKRESMGVYPIKNGKPDSNLKVTSVSYFLYTLKGSGITWDGNTIDYYQQPLGGNTGYSIVNDLRQKGYEIEEARTTTQNLNKLVLGRISAFAAQDISTDYLLDDKRYENIIKLPIPVSTKDYYLLFSHQFYSENKELAENIWHTIARIRDQMIYDLSKKY